MDSNQKSIDTAIAALQPDAPIYAAEIGADGVVTLILPSKRLTYSPSLREGVGGGSPPSSAPGASSSMHDDFTAIPYVGKEIANALHTAGYHTFHDLVVATDTALLDLPHISGHTLNKIREYLRKHYL